VLTGGPNDPRSAESASSIRRFALALGARTNEKARLNAAVRTLHASDMTSAHARSPAVDHAKVSAIGVDFSHAEREAFETKR